VGHNPKKRYPYPARSLKLNRLGFTMAGRPFKKSHDLFCNVNEYAVWFMPTLFNDTK
jgi:hypothetical protein